MIPLIEVMLVLLVVFMTAASLITHAVKIDLPKASTQPSPAHPERIAWSIDAAGRMHWDGEAVQRVPGCASFWHKPPSAIHPNGCWRNTAPPSGVLHRNERGATRSDLTYK